MTKTIIDKNPECAKDMDRFCDTFESWEECAFLEDYIQGDPYGIMDISSIIKK